MLSHQNLLLRSLLPSAFEAIEPELRLVFLHKGEDLTTRAHRRNVYFPISCVVAVYARSPATSETYLCLVGTGGVAGLSETLTTPGLHYVSRVTRAGYALMISRQRFVQRALLSQDVLHLQLVSTGMVAQLSLINASCAALHSSKARTARILLEAVAAWADSRLLDVEHRELADFICVRRETVTLMLKEIEREGLIKTGRGQVKVLDIDGLENVACECHRQSLDSKNDWYQVWKVINQNSENDMGSIQKNNGGDTAVNAGGGVSLATNTSSRSKGGQTFPVGVSVKSK